MRWNRMVAIGLLGLSGGCAWMGAYSPLLPVERRLIYYPDVYPTGDWTKPTVDTEDVQFTAADGTLLHGWFTPHPNPRGVALVCHGNAGNVTTYRDSVLKLHTENDLAVMSFDYRGYGRSSGQPSEEGVLMDARAARTWLSQRTGVLPEDMILMGFSLGGAVAVDLAGDGARGLVLWSTFATLPETGAHHFPWLPTGLLMTQRFESIRKIRHYAGPLLQSHGDADEVIPIAMGHRLHAEHRGPKRFITIPQAHHANADSAEYRHILAQFLDDLDEHQHESQAKTAATP